MEQLSNYKKGLSNYKEEESEKLFEVTKMEGGFEQSKAPDGGGEGGRWMGDAAHLFCGHLMAKI